MDLRDEEEVVAVTIRCAFQTAPDQTMDIPLTWTIKELKERIHLSHPSHPAVTSQRLIYGGGSLTDERILSDVFDETRRVIDGPQVVHLVCPLPQTSPEIRRRNNIAESTPVVQNSTELSYENMMANWNTLYANSGSNTADAYSEYYRNYYAYWQQYQMQVSAMNSPSYALPHPVYVQNGPGMPMFPYMAGAGQPGQPINLTGGNNQAVQMQFHAHVNAAHQQPAQADANVNAVNNNARRGLGMDEAMEILYKAVRVILLLSAVLLYSSLERFLLVMGIILVIGVTQFRRAQNRRAEAAAEARRVNNNNAGEQPNGVTEGEQNEGADADGAANRAEAEGEEGLEQRTAGAAGENVAEQVGGVQLFLSTCYTFVTSFITSLIPDNIPVDIN